MYLPFTYKPTGLPKSPPFCCDLIFRNRSALFSLHY